MGKKKKKKIVEVPPAVIEPVDETLSPVEVVYDSMPEGQHGDKLWFAIAVGITALAAAIRFFDLNLKPFHHDEGVNGWFLKTLFNDGVYKYDPANYHGPTLYYISLAFTKIFGFNTFAVRSSVALFGVLAVVLVLFLRRYLGSWASLFAALFVALSPGMSYISRYFIHEMFFVFCGLAVVVSVVYFIDRRRAGYFAIGWMVLLLYVCFLPSALTLAAYLGGANSTSVWAFRISFLIVESLLVYFVTKMLVAWDEGRPIYLLLASASAALMFATKETAFITLGTFMIACVCVWLWRFMAFSRVFEKNWFQGAIAAHLFLLAGLIYLNQTVFDAVSWLKDTFGGVGKNDEAFLLYSIIFMIVVATLAWFIFAWYRRRENEASFTDGAELTWSNFSSAIGGQSGAILIIAAVAVVFIYVNVLFFSSFFTYREGISKAIEAYAIWTKTGNKDHTQNGYFGYVKWGLKVESAIMIFSALGTLIALLRMRHRFAIFTALWAFGLFAAYTIIPYKTPWLALSFLLPMCMIAGYALGELVTSAKNVLRVSGVALATVGFAVTAYQAYQSNFVRYDDEEMSYVYAHTRRGFLDMISKIEQVAARSDRGKDATIEIVSPDYWPMTWYMNDYSHANFFGSFVDANTSEMIVAKKDQQDVEVIRRYSSHYKYIDVYPLRPGVNLVLLVRNDLAGTDGKELYKILEYKTIPGYTQ